MYMILPQFTDYLMKFVLFFFLSKILTDKSPILNKTE